MIGSPVILGPAGAPWVVVTHGMGLDGENMRPLAQALAKDFRVMLWTMPGHGGTPPPGDYSMDAFADELEAQMTVAGVTDPALLGFSFGGVVSQSVVARQKIRVRALIAYACFAPFHQKALIPAPLIGAFKFFYGLQRWANIQRDFAKACAVTPEGQASVAHAVARMSKPVFLATLESLLRSFQKQAEVRFDCPLLVLRGAEDVNRAKLEEASAALRRSHFHLVEKIVGDAGHCAHDDRLQQVAEAVLTFLKGV